MADGFEVEVPIKVKGGNEGEKVGRDIGSKIAAQLKKSFSAIGIGKTPSSGMGSSGIMKGISGKLAVIGAAITAVVALLAKASPYLKGILDLFGRAFMMFFRPFGDFLATLLRPLAILMMKMAVAFLKWTKPITQAAREGMETAPQIKLDTESVLGGLTVDLANWALQIGSAIGNVAAEIGKGAFELGVQIGDWLYTKVIEPVSSFIAEKIRDAFKWVDGIGDKIWDEILQPAWDWFSDVGTKIWDIIKSPFDSLVDAIMNSKIYKFFTGGGGDSDDVTNEDEDGKGGVVNWVKNLIGFQTGTNFVNSDGIYKLHRGEQVVRRGQSRSVIMNPTFNFNGNISQSVDIDEMMSRANQMNELELKQRGII